MWSTCSRTISTMIATAFEGSSSRDRRARRLLRFAPEAISKRPPRITPWPLIQRGARHRAVAAAHSPRRAASPRTIALALPRVARSRWRLMCSSPAESPSLLGFDAVLGADGALTAQQVADELDVTLGMLAVTEREFARVLNSRATRTACPPPVVGPAESRRATPARGSSPTTLAECVKRLRVAPSLAIVGTGTANTCYLRLRS